MCFCNILQISKKFLDLLLDNEKISIDSIVKRLNIPKCIVKKCISYVKVLNFPIKEDNGLYYLDSRLLLNKDYLESNLPFISNIYIFSIVNSTNTYMLQVENNIPTYSICLAEAQVSGKGRKGRFWSSPFGNIYCSFHVKDFNVNNFQAISISIGFYIAKALKNITKANIRVKWPNDIYLNGKKIAGILIESTQTGKKVNLVIGIGLNVNFVDDNEYLQRATSLRKEGFDFDRNFLLVLIVNKVKESLNSFQEKGITHIVDEWQNLDIAYNKEVIVTEKDKEYFGICKGITSSGNLILQNKKRLYLFNSCSIFLPCYNLK